MPLKVGAKRLYCRVFFGYTGKLAFVESDRKALESMLQKMWFGYPIFRDIHKAWRFLLKETNFN